MQPDGWLIKFKLGEAKALQQAIAIATIPHTTQTRGQKYQRRSNADQHLIQE
jgi:hypothetical protein